MNLEEIESCVINAFKKLDASYLYVLDNDFTYSNLDKEGIIQDLKFKIDQIKSKNLFDLKVLPSKCIFCYPQANAYQFVNLNNGELVIRIVIAQESINEFRIEECKNNPIPEADDGLPF
jgi:uncharacterized protein YtpQ (UPF0354 family)